MDESLDLTTINADALRTLQDVDSTFSPVVPYVVRKQSVPDADDSCGPVTEELI